MGRSRGNAPSPYSPASRGGLSVRGLPLPRSGQRQAPCALVNPSLLGFPWHRDPTPRVVEQLGSPAAIRALPAPTP
eukprot:5779636-Alexandrium_andersonii.AAC.1